MSGPIPGGHGLLASSGLSYRNLLSVSQRDREAPFPQKNYPTQGWVWETLIKQTTAQWYSFGKENKNWWPQNPCPDFPKPCACSWPQATWKRLGAGNVPLFWVSIGFLVFAFVTSHAWAYWTFWIRDMINSDLKRQEGPHDSHTLLLNSSARPDTWCIQISQPVSQVRWTFFLWEGEVAASHLSYKGREAPVLEAVRKGVLGSHCHLLECRSVFKDKAVLLPASMSWLCLQFPGLISPAVNTTSRVRVSLGCLLKYALTCQFPRLYVSSEPQILGNIYLENLDFRNTKVFFSLHNCWGAVRMARRILLTLLLCPSVTFPCEVNSAEQENCVAACPGTLQSYITLESCPQCNFRKPGQLDRSWLRLLYSKKTTSHCIWNMVSPLQHSFWDMIDIVIWWEVGRQLSQWCAGEPWVWIPSTYTKAGHGSTCIWTCV